MRRILVVLVAMAAISISSMGQDDLRLIKPGPLGRPSLVRGEGEGAEAWDAPISVYADGDIELFVPSRLTLGGTYWDSPTYRKNGTYSAYVFSFYKTDRDCRVHRIPSGHDKDSDWLKACAELRYNRRLIQVDTQKKTITIREVILMEGDGFPHPELAHHSNATIPLDSSTNPVLFRAITRITSMLEAELRRHPEP